MSNIMKTCHPLHQLVRKLPTGYKNPTTFVAVPSTPLFSSMTAVDLWTDGTNVYYEDNTADYVLKNGEWEIKTWNGRCPNGRYVWTDGANIYDSYAGSHYVLDGDTWKEKTWYGLEEYFNGNDVWTDGTNIYCRSTFSKDYILKGDTWERVSFSLSVGMPEYIWTDGTNIYYSYTNSQYVFQNGDWVNTTWNGLQQPRGNAIWTDGNHVYHSESSAGPHYVLNGDTWTQKTFDGYCNGYYIWSDGTRIYCDASSVLMPRKVDIYLKESTSWRKISDFYTAVIRITIDGSTFNAQPGMTWDEWIYSKYNSDPKFYVKDNMIFDINDRFVYHPAGNAVTVSDAIADGVAYKVSTNFTINGIAYYAVNAPTWADWINSPFNDLGRFEVGYEDGVWDTLLSKFVLNPDGTYVDISDAIEHGTAYIMSS